MSGASIACNEGADALNAFAAATLSRWRAIAPPQWLVSGARLIARGLIIGLGIAILFWAVTDWDLADASAYWEAALRLRAGEALYVPVANIEASSVYRYSPWFAWATIPLTLLPVQVAGAFWSLALVAASCLAVLPLARRGAWLQVAFFLPILIGISAHGNVHALLIAALVHGVEHRTGPLWIALTASLKAVPLAFALVYVGRGEWRRFLVAIGLTAALVAPAFLFYGDQIGNYVTAPGGAALLSAWPPLFVAVAATAAAGALRLARTRYAWLAASLAAALALPRFFVYDITFLLPGAAVEPRSIARRKPRPAASGQA